MYKRQAKNLGLESMWSALWKGVVPVSSGSWIPEAFDLDVSVTLPTSTMTFVLHRGRAVIDGYSVDFSGESGPIEIDMDETDGVVHGHVHLSLQLVYVDGRVTGYQWHQDLDTPVVRESQITVGMAVCQDPGSGWRKWYPYSSPEGFCSVTGSYDSNTSPKNKKVGLGFEPVAVILSQDESIVTASIEDYGFTLSADDAEGTFQAFTLQTTS